PAINSASSIARWIDCTVDSMLTTTPFFMPRDGCDPMPTISSSPSSVIAPTIATTFDVPISSPTIILPSCPLAMRRDSPFFCPECQCLFLALIDFRVMSHPCLSLQCVRLQRSLLQRNVSHRFFPADGQAIAVAQIDVVDAIELRRQ